MILKSDLYAELSEQKTRATVRLAELSIEYRQKAKAVDSLEKSLEKANDKLKSLTWQKERIQAKLDTFTVYNKVCYERVPFVENKKFLKRTWGFKYVEIPCVLAK